MHKEMIAWKKIGGGSRGEVEFNCDCFHFVLVAVLTFIRKS